MRSIHTLHRSFVAVVAILLFCTSIVRADPTTQPADIAPAAQTLLGQVREAYAHLDSLDLAGTYTFDTDAAGDAVKKSAEFTAAFVSPNKIRHEMRGDVTIVGTGDAFVIHLAPRNGYLNLPSGKGRGDALPEQVSALLEEQNPSLRLALSADASAVLLEGATKVFTDDANTLRLEQSDRDIRIAFDPTTHLIRTLTIDLRKLMSAAGVPNVMRATATIEYARSAIGVPIDTSRFAWTAPAGATQLKPDAPELAGASPEDLTAGGDDDSAPAMKLVAKPAPAFTLNDANGKSVSLAQLKGNVVVLDFWATWCPPCRASLPHLAELSARLSESHENVRIFAVNLREDREKVAAYLKQTSLTLAVLFDETGNVAKKYDVTGIPQTVVIGPDGIVKNVFIGYGPGDESKLAAAIRNASGASPKAAEPASTQSATLQPATSQPAGTR